MINFFPEPLKKRKPKIPLFIHIPKAAGTSIRKFVSPYISMIDFFVHKGHENSQNQLQDICKILNGNYLSENSDLSHAHQPISYYEKILTKEQLDDCFIFTFVRNPFSRLVSSYHYLTNGADANEDDAEIGSKLSKDFKTFVKKELAFYLPGGGHSPDGQTHLTPMHWYIDGYYDFIGKVENINEDFQRVCDKADRDRIQLPIINKSTHKHYTEYYDKETKHIVETLYAKDIEMFGYKFGE